MKVRIPFKESVIFATGSLLHYVEKEARKHPNDKNVDLVFPQTTLRWRDVHKGPREDIISEYVIPCILNDILQLQENGFTVSVLMPEEIDL